MESLTRVFQQPVSRRDFLKWGSLAFLGLYLPDFYPKSDSENPLFFGRVLNNVLPIYELPGETGRLVRVYWRDLVLPVTDITVANQPSHNRVWYRVKDEGYAHSGSLQPVETNLSDPVSSLLPEGQLGEVCVPFSDGFRDADPQSRAVYRIYYNTTHWVLASIQGKDGKAWYRLLDDKWKRNLYVPASHIRIVPPEELTTLSDSLELAAKRLEIRLADQALIALENERPVFMTRIASGARFSNGDFTTLTGRYMTYHKRPTRHMAAGDHAAANSYDLPGVPWVCYFTPEGISIHGTFWHNDFGRPRSHGCINLSVQAARWVYRWTLPAVPFDQDYTFKDYGTPIDIVS